MSTSQSARYNPIISKLYQSRNTVLYILKNIRGFDTSDYEDFSINELQAMYKNKQMDMIVTNAKTNKKIFIKYHLAATGAFPKLKSASVYEYIDDLFDIEMDENGEPLLNNNDELIIITKDKVNDSLRTLIEQIYLNDKRFINVYNLNDYLCNILENDLVPPHRVMNEEEKLSMIKKLYITDMSQFPEISRFDPVAQSIGARPGDLLEITRSSPTAVTCKYYRLCH